MPAWFARFAMLGFLLSTTAAAARAGDTEIREFNILIDGKPAGAYLMTITRQDDGAALMSAQADSQVTFLAGLYKYTYSFRGTEVWKGGRLTQMETTASDNGKRLAVSASAEGAQLRVRAGGQERMCRPDVWTTTFWQLPPAGQRNQAIALLDADTGREIASTLRYVDTSAVRALGQTLNAAHYRLSGQLQFDLWYDGQERLLRQEWMEDGHRCVLELTRVRR